MYKVLKVTPPKFPDILNSYTLVVDDDVVPGEQIVCISPTHVCVMFDGSEKQVSELMIGDEIIMY